MMIWNGCERKRSWPDFKILSRLSSEGYDEIHENLIACLPAEIWTRHLQNTKQEC
jgi:hypothetical protein